MYHPVPSFALDRQFTSIELPTGLTSLALGDGAFSGCSSMMSIELPSCLTSLSVGAPSLAPRVLVYWVYGLHTMWVEEQIHNSVRLLCDCGALPGI